MKKNITINLCGRLFQIDEDAYEMLLHYIESLRHSFGRQEGGNEIVDDIEARIAELFTELREQGNEAITIEHVKSIITRIGEPEQLTGEEQKDEEKDEGHKFDSFSSAAQGIYDNVRKRTAGKKLYRNPKDKMVAGVLSGFAKYTNTDPIIWRLVFALLVLCYGVGILAYIILAIVLPEAKTPEQLLQMEGKDVTPQNLADVVVDKDGQQQPTPNLFRSFFSILLKILFGFFVCIAIVVCVCLCCGFLFTLVVLVSALTLPVTSNLPFSLQAMGLAELYQTNPMVLLIFSFSLFVMLLIPIYAIIHMILSLTGKTQPMGMGQRIAWIVLWVAALCCLVPCSIQMANYVDESHRVQQYDSSTVYQDVYMDSKDADFLRQGGWNLLKAENCHHYTWSGAYYNGSRSVRYLDTYNDDCLALLQAERKQAVEPGVYRLDCIARSEGPGPCVYAIGDDKLLKDIPAYGDKGGELVEQLRQGVADVEKNDSSSTDEVKRSSLELNIMGMKFVFSKSTKGKDNRPLEEGYGWSIVSIEDIVVSGDSIAYGLSSDEAFTGQPCRAKWFSATDFKLTRTGDLPRTRK